VLAPLVDKGALMVVGAVYSLDTGKVAWLPDRPAKTVALAPCLQRIQATATIP